MAAKSFGTKLKELRTAKGLSQQQLADAAGLSQTAVSQWEADTREPGWSAVQALAAVLGVSCEEFQQQPKKKGK